MAKIRMNELSAELSEAEQAELERASMLPPVFDEDSPEMTAEMLLQFKRMSHADRTRQTVSLRLSPGTLKLAKAYGKGYTSFLSRLLDEAIRDEALVRKCL